MAMFNDSNIDVETFRFSYKTIAGAIKLPVQVRPLQDEAHEIAKQFAIVNHIHGDDIVNQLSEEVSKFITSSLRRRLKRAQSEIQMMQTVYNGDLGTSSSGTSSYINEYRYDKVQKLEEENMQFRTIIDSSDNDLKKVLKDLTDQANKSRIKADKANQKLNRLQERLDSEEEIDHVFQRLESLKSALLQEKNITHSLRDKLDEVGMDADNYKRQVYELKDQMGVALDSVADSRLAGKVDRLQDEVRDLRAKLSEERRRVHDLEATAKQSHGMTHMAVAEWAIERRRAKFANNNNSTNSNTQRNVFGQKLLSNGGEDHNIATSGNTSDEKLSAVKAPSLQMLTNLLKEAKWAIDTKHWDNISRYEFLACDETDVFKEPKLEDPVFLRKSLRDMRYARANSIWNDRINKNIPHEKLLSIAVNASSQLSELQHVIVQLEKDRENYKVKYRQAVLEGEKLKEKYRENLFSEKLGNKIQNPSPNQDPNQEANSSGDFQPLSAGFAGRQAWMTWASEKFKMKQELNTAREEYLKQLNEERQKFDILAEEVAIELYKLLAIWEHERRERNM